VRKNAIFNCDICNANIFVFEYIMIVEKFRHGIRPSIRMAICIKYCRAISIRWTVVWSFII